MFDRWNDISDDDFDKVKEIRKRAFVEFPDALSDPVALLMDLQACHIAEHLNLDKLLNFPPGDFGHDVFGIMRHLDRDTGKLLMGFWPRCGGR